MYNVSGRTGKKNDGTLELAWVKENEKHHFGITSTTRANLILTLTRVAIPKHTFNVNQIFRAFC